ncbi:MAG: DUF3943 domain-containing protein [Prevotella sp.]|uniref:DUF3943 domain-containing protein n=1 Tax=Prevotella sp. TaxID=59823 RepID=UPI002A2E25CC|nr:DUF3943 domain-containing protein [Prevotella sp.]MDD7317744.1 DUF3943 domain-containing protein [Prevotellaceae bacterium]MDY4020659.1 DUF3943 domain-containing protein [Prevotella sp.]
MKKALFLIGIIIFGVGCLSVSAQDMPKGHRVPNIAVGWNNHNESMLTSPFNVGLVSEVDSLRGFQSGLLYGGIRHYARGAMIAGITNAAHAMSGVQVAGLSNIVFTPMKGIQVGALSNTALGVKRGMQLAGISNISAATMRGVQVAAYNYADTLNGTQIGLINVALEHTRGVQVGIINYSRDTPACKIGLVNLNPDTRIDYMLFAGSSSKLNAAMRFRNRNTYSIIGIGTHYMGFDEDFSGALYYRLGKYFTLSPRWSVSGDLGYYHIETFKKNSTEAPERLYSIQAKLNVDYQINRTLGAFVSVGYGTTRNYGSHTNYRTRPLVMAGLTLRYNHNRSEAEKWVEEKVRDYNYHRNVLGNTPPDSIFRFYDPYFNTKKWAMAIGQTAGINVLVHLFDRCVMGEDFAKTTLNTTWSNFRHAFVWDNDQFSTNLFAHPYHGNLYFNSARSNGFNFWESAPFALCGSLMWEFFGEIEPPAVNDLLATTFGGIAIGEVFHRVSAVILNDRKRGGNRFLREAAAAIINPMQGFARIVNGDAWRVRRENFLYHDFTQVPVELTLTLGNRYLADDGGLFRGEHQPFLSVNLIYGDPFNEQTAAPYDYFTANLSLGFSGNQPAIHGLHLLGRLWSTTIYDGDSGKTLFGIFQHFNYYDSKPVKDGTSLTPYRISEAASLGPGMIWRFPKVGNIGFMEQQVYADIILLGGTKSDYYSIIDRDYNMGSGYSFKAKSIMVFPRVGRFILNLDYYRIFTWKGYENKDLAAINPVYLNSQGDRSNAQLLVINPMFVFHLKNNWGIEFSGSYFVRDTRYRYHDNMRANTFEVRAGLVYRF